MKSNGEPTWAIESKTFRSLLLANIVTLLPKEANMPVNYELEV